MDEKQKKITQVVVKTGVFLILLIFFLIYLEDVFVVLSYVIAALSPVIIGLVIAYVLNHPMNSLERTFRRGRFFQRKNRARGIALVLTYLITVCILLILAIVITPQIVETVQKLLPMLPDLFTGASDEVQSLLSSVGIRNLNFPELPQVINAIVTRFFTSVETAATQALSLVSDIFVGVYNVLMGALLSIYILLDKDRLLKYFKRLIRSLLPKKVSGYTLVVLNKANDIFGSYLSTKLITSLLLGLGVFVLCSVISIPLPLLCAVIIAASNLVPLIGPIVGGGVSALLVFVMEPMSAIWYLIIIVVLVQIEGNILLPKLMSQKMGMPAILVLAGVIVGGGFFGVIGMILGPPVAVLIYYCLNMIMAHKRGQMKRQFTRTKQIE